MKLAIIPTLSLLLAMGSLAQAVPADSEQGSWRSMASHYEAIRLALVADGTDGVADHAQALADEARSLAKKFDAGRASVAAEQQDACIQSLTAIGGAASGLAKAESLDAARTEFAKLTEPMMAYRDMMSGVRPMVVYCPMVKKSWLQPDGEIGNPYAGDAMARCGVVKSK